MTALREKFSSRLGFVLATAGSAVGIGNLVGFPVNAAKNGGGAFLVIYLVFVALWSMYLHYECLQNVLMIDLGWRVLQKA